MSHLETIDLHIKDLAALKAAAAKLGLSMQKQDTYRWFGRHVGDYPVPAGFTVADLGKCDYALTVIRQPGESREGVAFEVGVVRRRDGKPGFQLMYDFWAGGLGLERRIGEGAQLLTQGYTREVAVSKMRSQGYAVRESVRENGEIVLTCTKKAGM